MLELILETDTSFFLFLNNIGNENFDTLWLAISNKVYSIPFFLLIIILLFKKYGYKVWIPLLCIILLITIVDQTSVHLFKNIFQRLRPCWQNDLDNLFRLVYAPCGGQYGFISSHAANTAALGTFCFSVFKKNKWLKKLIIIWVLLISYSRIYLGVHFPLDVFCGILWGVIIGFLFIKINSKFLYNG